MARPKICRQIDFLPDKFTFSPESSGGENATNVSVLSLEELEAVKLADLEGKKQSEAAELMNVSRQTFGRILDKAHKAVADALINGKVLHIEGGSYCPFAADNFLHLEKMSKIINNIPEKCKNCCKYKKYYLAVNIISKESFMNNNKYKIAVVTNDGVTVSGHFGPSKMYSIFTVENGNVVNRENVEKPNFHTPGEPMHQHGGHGDCNDAEHNCKHGAMIEPIMDCKFMVCGGMGQGIYNNLIEAQIAPIITNMGTIEEAVMSLVNGTLENHIEKLH